MLATLSISSPLSSWVSLTLARLRSALSHLDSYSTPFFLQISTKKPSPANIRDAQAQNPAESERKLFKFRSYIFSPYTLCPWCNRWQSWRHYWGQVQSAGGRSEWTSSWWESLIKGILPKKFFHLNLIFWIFWSWQFLLRYMWGKDDQSCFFTACLGWVGIIPFAQQRFVLSLTLDWDQGFSKGWLLTLMVMMMVREIIMKEH